MIALSHIAQQLAQPSNENDPAERPRKVDDKFRAYRRRQRLGLRIFALELPEFAVVSWLIEHCGLTEEQALDPDAVTAALERYLIRAAKEIRYR